jgi:hypothetical protein
MSTSGLRHAWAQPAIAMVYGAQLKQPIFAYGPLMLANPASLDEVRRYAYRGNYAGLVHARWAAADRIVIQRCISSPWCRYRLNHNSRLNSANLGQLVFRNHLLLWQLRESARMAESFRLKDKRKAGLLAAPVRSNEALDGTVRS